MLCRFQGGKQPCAAAPAPGAALVAAGGPPGDDALAPILAGLVGREVAVLAGGRIARGKLIDSNPITLVGPEGQVTILTGPAASVQF